MLGVPQKIKEKLQSQKFRSLLKKGVELTNGWDELNYDEDLKRRLNQIFDDDEFEWKHKEISYDASQSPLPLSEHFDEVKEWRVGIKVTE